MRTKILKTLSDNIKLVTRSNKKQLKVLDEISYLATSGLKINEIEEFINVKISDYDLRYFKENFKNYTNLNSYLNSIELIAYITFIEKIKTTTLNRLVKKIIYPIILITFAFVTLLTFKFSVMPLFESFSKQNFLAIINLLFYISVTFLSCIVILVIFYIYVFRQPDIFIMLYYRFYNFRLFKIIEMYYICILSHLLITFDNQGMSTYNTFSLINKFKGNTIIANLAYFVSADLAKGSGLEESIKNMHINNNFKNIIIMGMRTNNYNKLITQYNQKMTKDIIREIDLLSNALLFIAYSYIGIIVIFLYQILSLPISLINDL